MGKTHGSYKQRRVVEKHPHARGEDRDGIIVYLPLAETPPRTWGRRVHVRIVAVRRGNTPTHVGKTRKNRNRKNRSQKHPHARGEDRGRARQYRSVQETPPRTWGRRVGTSSIVIRPGNTPTHVGKTLHRRQALSGNRKHPHARGEDTWNLLAFFLLTFNKELGRHLNQKLKIFPFGRNTGLQAKKSNSSVDESLSPQCTWL